MEINLLDSLGPEFGTIQSPNLDTKSFMPFEGNNLSLPSINFPISREPIYAPESSVINQKIQKKNKQALPKQNVASMLSTLAAQTASGNDRVGQATSYNAGSSGTAFYDRYMAYGEDTFDKIGFHPLRDNEKVFNTGTSVWDDTKRMLAHSFVPLFTSGFMSGPKSLGKMLQGDFSGDPEEAEIYERASAIGMSTKKGLGAFMSNTALNFGYTAGIIVEAIAEDALLALATAATGGGAAPVLGARAVQQGANIARGIKGFGMLSDAATGLRGTLSNLNNINNIRKVWSESKLLTSTANFLNPLENLTGTLKDLNKLGSVGDLAKSYSTYAKTAGALYRDVRGINMALSEARLEGGFVENTVYDKLYREHLALTGERPDESLQKEMMNQAKRASMETVAINTALIFASNKITFPNIVGGKSGVNRWLNGTIEEITRKGKTSVTTNMTTTTLKSGKRFNKLGFGYNDGSFKSVLSNLKKDPFRAGIRGLLKYSKVNINEGLQEVAQETIQGAMTDYYVNTFNDPTKRNSDYNKLAWMTAAKSQFSDQGFETFMSGFAMGIFGGGLNKVSGWMMEGVSKYSDPEQYQKMKELQQKFGKQMADQANAINVKDFFDSKVFNLSAQAQASKVINNPNSTTNDVINAEDYAFGMQVISAIENGTLKYFEDYISSMKNLTPEELEEALELESGKGSEYLGRIDKVLSRIENLNSRHESNQKKFPNPIDIKSLDQNDPDYSNKALLYTAWNNSVMQATMFGHNFERSNERMLSLMDKISNTPEFSKLNYNDVRVLFNTSDIDADINYLTNSIRLTEESGTLDPEQRKTLNNDKNRLKRLENYKEALSNYLMARPEQRAKLLAQVKEELISKGEDISTYTDEELNALIEKQEPNLNDANSIRQLEKAYKKYLKTLANVSDTFVFSKELDNTFGELLDMYTLREESEMFAQALELLTDPQYFLENVNKNKGMLEKLYNSRKSYYEAIVKEGIANANTNKLIQDLAEKNIYISAEDLENWTNNKILPKEFIYDDGEGTTFVIPESSEEYAEYIKAFVEIANDSVNAEIVDEELNNKLEELEKRKQDELNSLNKTTEKVLVETLNIPFEEIINNLKENQEAAFQGGMTSVTAKVENGVLKVYGMGNLISNTKFLEGKGPIEVRIFEVKEKEVNQDIINEIEERYEKEKNEIIESYSFKPSSTPTQKVYDINNYLENRELFEELMQSFLNQQDTTGLEDSEINNLFEAWLLKGNRSSIFDKYNVKPSTPVTKPSTSKITVDNSEIDLLNASLEDLENYKKILLEKVNTIQSTPGERSSETNLELVKLRTAIQAIDLQIENLTKSPEQQRVLQVIEEKVLDVQNKVVREKNGSVKVNGKEMTRVTSLIKSLLDSSFYNKEIKEIKALYKTSTSTQDFIEKLKSKNYPGFDKSTYKAIEDLLNDKITIQKDDTNKTDNILDQLEQTILSNIYKDSTEAGNYVDEQIKNAFNNKETVFDDNNISQVAYDKLFGEDGIITQIKRLQEQEGFIIISDGLTVFDEDLGVAGEMDLLAVDKNGNLFIIDVKTSKNWDNFEGSDKEKQYTLQQEAYSRLLFNMTGLNSKISLLPFEIKQGDTSNSKLITDVNTPVEKGLRINLQVKDSDSVKLDKVLPLKEISPSFASINLSVENPTNSDIKTYNELKTQIENKDVTVDQLNEIEVTVMLKLNLPSALESELLSLIETKKQELKENTTSIVPTASTQPISKKDVYVINSDTEFLSSGTSVKVIKEEGDQVTVKELGKGKKKTYIINRNKITKFEELNNKSFMEREINKELQDNTKDSMDVLNSILQDSKLLEEVEKLADSKSEKDLVNSLINNLKC